MELDKIRITDIEPADYNPRQINNEQYSKLSRSIQDFGLVDPIIINLQNNKIIGGHQRYKVLLDGYTSNDEDLYLLKLGDIGWVFPSTDLKIESDEHEKALNILLNQQNLMGEWDNQKLELILTELDDVSFDLEMTGFDDYELDLLLDGDYESFSMDDFGDDDAVDDLPSDYVDVTGENKSRSFVISIGFDDQVTANKYLEFLGYEREMTGNTLQFMFNDLEIDIDEMLLDKYNKEEDTE